MDQKEIKEETAPEKLRRKRITAIGIVLFIIILIAVIAVKIYIPILKMADNPEEFRAYMDARGLWGTVLFIVIVALQVVTAVIPAGPLEVVAGYCFGTVKGTIIADIGLTLGSIMIFLLVRRFGMGFIELFFSKEKIESMKFLKTSGQSKIVLFLLFLIPGTPKDILSYGVGLTDLSLISWILITSIGRIPSILFSTMGGDALLEGRYGLLIAIIIVLAAAAGIGTILYRRWARKQ